MESTNKRDRAVAVAILLAFTLGVFGFLQLSIRPFFAYAAGGALLIHLATAARAREWLPLIVIAPGFALCYSAIGAHFGVGADAVPSNALAFLGLGSCVLLGWKAIHDAKSLGPFLASVVIPLCGVAVALVLGVLVPFQPLVYDFYLYRFDAAFGAQASAIVGRWLIHWPFLKWTCTVCYEALPLAQSAVVAFFFRTRIFPRDFFISAGVAGMAGCALYQLMPALGPVHVFGPSFVSEMHLSVPLNTVFGTPTAPRNSMPSLHLAWALLILWSLKPGQRLARLLAVLFVIATVLATLGSGEHYLVDLIVAVPFATSVQRGCQRQWKLMTLYAAITVLWIAYLRFGMVLRTFSRRGVVSWRDNGLASRLAAAGGLRYWPTDDSSARIFHRFESQRPVPDAAGEPPISNSGCGPAVAGPRPSSSVPAVAITFRIACRR